MPEPANDLAAWKLVSVQECIANIPPEIVTGGEVLYNLSSAEMALFSYKRSAVMLLAAIDISFTILNLTALLYPESNDVVIYWGVLISFILGPICGYFGASRLLAWPVWVYGGLVVAKTIYQVSFFLFAF